MKRFTWSGLVVLLLSLFLVGCQVRSDRNLPNAKQETPKGTERNGKAEGDDEAEIQAARAELPAEDRQLVDAQDFCPIMEDQRLGAMGKPYKVMIKDQPVFLCCKGCQRKALADPEKTLARVEKLKENKERPKTTGAPEQ